MNAAPARRVSPGLLEGLAALPRDVEISDLTQDGRAAQPGCAFLAVHGTNEHGLEYAPQAVANGARAVLWEPAPAAVVPDLPVRKSSWRRSRACASAPARSPIASSARRRARCRWRASPAPTARPPAPIYWRRRWKPPAGPPPTWAPSAPGGRAALTASALTTGDAVTVQRTLAGLQADGAASVAMEVSSHAIDQGRVGAVRFRTAAFTNLTRDHLDYHGTMESYGAAKARLFTREDLVSRVINVDDAFGRQLARDPRGRGRLIVTSRGHQSHARSAAGFVRAMHVELSARGIELEFDSSWGPGAPRPARWSATSTSRTC